MRLVVALAAAALLAGCVVPSVPSAGGRNERSPVALEVISAKLVPGRCFDGAQAFGEVCHELQVRIDNSARTNDLATNSLVWKGVDTDGGVIDFGDSDKDAVAGGATTTLKVSFTTKDGAPHLAKVRYDGFQGQGEAAVPVY